MISARVEGRERGYEGGTARKTIDVSDEMHLAEVVLVRSGGYERVVEEEVVVGAVT